MSNEITEILDRIAGGKDQAISELVPLVYSQMRKIAANAVRGEKQSQCDPTELVHEAYIRMVGNQNLAWKSRSHFFGACAVVIRRILVDQARAAGRQKRGGQLKRVLLEGEKIGQPDGQFDLIELDEALLKLSELSPRQAKLVELRFFGGLTEKEAAEVLQISKRTASGDWVMAKAWLKVQLG
ncbi:MAG: ECF-type sigma factor [Mariniblastus sp.]